MKIYRHIPDSGYHPPCVLTIGNYDGIHLGHQKLIDELLIKSKSNQIESAIMIFEPHPREFFTPKDAPTRITSLREKIEYFQSRKIDRIYIIKFNMRFALMSGNEFIFKLKEQITAHTILVGEDFRFGRNREFGITDLLESDIKTLIVKEIKNNNKRVSSTHVRDALASGDLDLAKDLLGRYYSISGKVIHGDHLGRELGYPTANIHMFHNRPPIKGVFAVKLNEKFGVANLGTRPTLKGISKLHLEVHVLNFSKDLYGHHVRITFLKKIRDEIKFESTEDLKLQIKKDITNAEIYLKNYD
ncbi:bifunctional riboflavin kinase/FAD synthetase [Methylophilaceae bacterium]|jgi:riboflavin kinase / FMN adenylyltransferase|nr:bifunctional riboflavin kinase/FAD synthetase [Methylophilaceae bacterium]|tara:strand:- start:140 stop:1042 length:903 start_codon:yes stop_codon:yes gene_type:complete